MRCDNSQLLSSSKRLELARYDNGLNPDMDQKTAKAVNPVTLGYMKQLDLTKNRIRRAGVVVYSVIGDEIYFGLGVDSKHSEITDFGGSVENRDKDAIDGAIREFREESLNAFGNLTRSMISNCFVMHDASTLIVFVHLSIDPQEVSNRFELARRTAKTPEVDAIVWLSKDQLQSEINKEKDSIIYSVVRQLMYRSGDFFDWL